MLINRAPSNFVPVPQINTHIIFTSYNYHATNDPHLFK